MKELISKVKINKSSLPFKIVTDNIEILGETNTANEFNNFFTDIDLKLAREIPGPPQPFEIYMTNVSSEVKSHPLSINELRHSFFSSKINKSIFQDDISFGVVSKCFGELCTSQKHIFGLSFENGILPDSLNI